MIANAETQSPNEHQLALAGIVSQAYAVFSGFPTPDRLINYGGPCRDHELEAAMCKVPLREVSAELFYSYFMEPTPDRHSNEEFLYFLPRILDLLAQGEDTHFALSLALANVNRCPSGTLSPAAVDVLDRFVLAFFKNLLGPNQWSRRWAFQQEDAVSVLCMAHLAGSDIGPLLAWWVQTDDPQATRHFVETGYLEWWGPEAGPSPFVEDDADFLNQIQAWLGCPQTRARFAEKLRAPAFQHLLAMERGVTRGALQEKVDVALMEFGALRA